MHLNSPVGWIPKAVMSMSAHIDLFSTARELVNQAPPPSLREILSAYRAKGDGDRDMLLAMLSAKTAEDQSHSNRAALCRTLIEAQQHISYPPSPPIHHDYYVPTPSALHSPPHSSRDAPSPKRNHYLRAHSPYTLAPISESRKRHRASQSPPRDQEPPSPASSSSSITDSPRSARPSMAIGALLSTGLSHERTKDYPMSS